MNKSDKNQSDKNKPETGKQGRRTRLVHGARPSPAAAGLVNPPVERASTVLIADLERGMLALRAV